MVDSEEFVALSSDEIALLISSDKLTVPSEEKVRNLNNSGDAFNTMMNVFTQVYEAVVTWVSNDPAVREEKFPSLMEHVRLPLLSREYLIQHVEGNSLMRSNASCKSYQRIEFFPNKVH